MKAPNFRTEDAERQYWATHSAAEFIDALPAVEIEIVAPRRRRERIALSADALRAIKTIARHRKMPYQRLMQTWLLERLQTETLGVTAR